MSIFVYGLNNTDFILRYGVQYDNTAGGWSPVPYDVTVTRNEGEGFGFVVISSTNKATSTIGKYGHIQLYFILFAM